MAVSFALPVTTDSLAFFLQVAFSLHAAINIGRDLNNLPIYSFFRYNQFHMVKHPSCPLQLYSVRVLHVTTKEMAQQENT